MTITLSIPIGELLTDQLPKTTSRRVPVRFGTCIEARRRVVRQ